MALTPAEERVLQVAQVVCNDLQRAIADHRLVDIIVETSVNDVVKYTFVIVPFE